MSESLHFPRSDAQGGWRTLEQTSEIRKLTGMDKARLDEAFQYAQTTSQHGGLLVVRNGYLVYEKYFGRGNREANPNMYSIGKMFTSVACGIMLPNIATAFPMDWQQKVFTQDYLPEAFPLSDPRMADIQLGNLLTMTSGIQQPQLLHPGGKCRAEGHQTAIVHGENVELPYWISSDPVLPNCRTRMVAHSMEECGRRPGGIPVLAGSSHRLHRSSPHSGNGTAGVFEPEIRPTHGLGSMGLRNASTGGESAAYSGRRRHCTPFHGCLALWASAAAERQMGKSADLCRRSTLNF